MSMFVGGGAPERVLYTFNSGTSAASIAATGTVANIGSGTFKICISLFVVATGSGTVTASLNINNGASAISGIALVPSLSLSALTNVPQQACGTYFINTNNANPLQFLTTYAATGSYQANVAVMKLS